MAPIKTLLIRKRFHFSSKGTAASLAESRDRCYTRIDAAAGEGGDLPFAARAPRRPSFPVGAFAGACSIVDPTEFSCLAVAFNRALVVADEQSRRLSFLNDQPEQHLNPGHFAPTRHIELRPLTCGQLFEVLNMPRIGMFSSPGTHTNWPVRIDKR